MLFQGTEWLVHQLAQFCGEGFADETTDGGNEEVCVGAGVGSDVGSDVGTGVGNNVGASVGVVVGILVGKEVGLLDKDVDGRRDFLGIVGGGEGKDVGAVATFCDG